MSRILAFWRLINLPCRDVTRLASGSLDRELGRGERVALRSHILYCRSCRRYLRQILILRRAMRRVAARPDLAGPGAEASLPDGVRDRIKKALRGDN